MKALVTGAAGFIGSTLVQRLVRTGTATTVGVDNYTDYYDPELKFDNTRALAADGVQVLRGDLNSIDLDSMVADVDVVFHLAGQPGVRRSWGTEFDQYLTANVSATQRVLEAVRRSSNRPRVVYASSSSVYGEAESYPTDEATMPRPRSPYGVTKLAGEHLCRLYAANESLLTVSLRFFTVYGPRQRPDMAFTRFLTAALRGDPIHVFGSGEQIRDFTYVDDIVEALVKAATVDVSPGSVYNVSGGGSHSVNEVLEVMGGLLGQPLEIIRQGAALGDVTRTTADISAITTDLKWSPSTALRAGLTAQLDWLKAVRANPVDWS